MEEKIEKNLQTEIALLLSRVNEKTKYKNLQTTIKNGGVSIIHPSGVLICYASIIDGQLEPELYNVDYQAKIEQEEKDALNYVEQIEKEEGYKEVDLIEPKKESVSDEKKIKRKQEKRFIENIIVSLATAVLLYAGYTKGIETYKQYKDDKKIQNYIGKDTNILINNTHRTEDYKYPMYENGKIAVDIKESGKNPWPLLTDLIMDMESNKINNFPTVVNHLHDMGYFEYDYENLVIIANARKEDGSCDFDKLIKYMKEHSLFIISQEQLNTMSKEVKDDVSTFLVEYNDVLDTLTKEEKKEKNKGL